MKVLKYVLLELSNFQEQIHVSVSTGNLSWMESVSHVKLILFGMLIKKNVSVSVVTSFSRIVSVLDAHQIHKWKMAIVHATKDLNQEVMNVWLLLLFFAIKIRLSMELSASASQLWSQTETPAHAQPTPNWPKMEHAPALQVLNWSITHANKSRVSAPNSPPCLKANVSVSLDYTW